LCYLILHPLGFSAALSIYKSLPVNAQYYERATYTMTPIVSSNSVCGCQRLSIFCNCVSHCTKYPKRSKDHSAPWATNSQSTA